MKKKANVKKGTGTPNIVVQDIRTMSVDRTKKSIGKWRAALRAAETTGTPNRSALYDIYDEIMLDGHLTGIVSKRILAAAFRKIEYHDKAGKKVDELDDLINGERFRELVKTVLETILWGVSAIEFQVGKEFAYTIIPRKHIKPEAGIISYEQYGTEGVEFDNESMLWVIHDRYTGEKILPGQASLGLLLKCAPYVIYKRDVIVDWATYIEIFGQPVRIIKYDANDVKTRLELETVMKDAGTSLAIMIPEQANFDMKDGKQSNGTGELQEKFKDTINQEMSIIVLGNTETTTNGKTGTGAKSEVHQKQQQLIEMADVFYLSSRLNDPQLHAIIRSFYPSMPEGKFVVIDNINPDELLKRIETDKKLSELVAIDPDYFYEKYGIPKPTGDTQQAPKPQPENKPEPKPEPKPKPENKPAERPRKLWFERRSVWQRLKLFVADFFA